MSIGEAALMLGTDRRTVRRYIETGALAAYQTPGGQWRIPPAGVEAIRQGPSASTQQQAQVSSHSGPSPTLKNLQERIKERELGIQDRKLAREERKLDEEDAEEREKKRRAREAADAGEQREEQERDRQRDRQKWRAVAEGWSEAYIPEAALPTLKAEFRRTVKRTLDECKLLDGVPDAAMDAIAVAAAEIFGPWEQQRQTEARTAWLEQQVNEAWTSFGWRFHLEGLTVLDAELRYALRGEITGTMQGLGPDSSWGALYQAREQTVDAVLAACREKKEAAATSDAASREYTTGGPSPGALTQHAIAAAVEVVKPHLQERHRQGFLSPSLDSRDVDLLVHIAEDKVRTYLKAEARKRGLTEDEAKQLARDFIDTDYQLI